MNISIEKSFQNRNFPSVDRSFFVVYFNFFGLQNELPLRAKIILYQLAITNKKKIKKKNLRINEQGIQTTRES